MKNSKPIKLFICSMIVLVIVAILSCSPSLLQAEEWDDSYEDTEAYQEYEEESQDNMEADSEESEETSGESANEPSDDGDETEETTQTVTEESKDENGFPIINCQSAIVIDAKTGQVIYEKDGYSKQYPASTTKIMTGLLLLENGNMNDTLTMSENAIWGIDRDSSNIGLDVGEKISMIDGIYAILMSSANEVCVAGAEHILGSTDAFVTLMNNKAKEIGCTKTNFTNVNGLHDDNHYTCAYDLAIIAKEAFANDAFKEISGCNYYEIPPTNLTGDIRYLWQNNELVSETSDYYYSYCTGGKTGYTEQAGGVLVSWATYNDLELICVVMNTHPKSNIFADSIKLYDYMFYNYYHNSFLNEYEFSPEQLTDAQKLLNNYYGCENAGKLKLSADTNMDLLINYETSIDNIWKSLSLSTERIDEGIIGILKIHDSKLTYIDLPVYFSGYIKSDDPEAIRKAYAEGILRSIPEGKTNSIIKKLAIWIIIFIIIIIFLPISFLSGPKSFLLSLCNKISPKTKASNGKRKTRRHTSNKVKSSKNIAKNTGNRHTNRSRQNTSKTNKTRR